MKKSDEQLQQEVAESHRFISEDSRDVAIKARVMEEPDEYGDAFIECPCRAVIHVNETHRDKCIYCWKCGQKLDWSDVK